MDHNNSKEKISSSSSKSLKHRFSQLLLSSSCTAATAAASTTTKLINPSVVPLSQPLNHTEECRCKLDRSSPLTAVVRCRASPVAAASPVIGTSIDYGLRRSFHSSEPTLDKSNYRREIKRTRRKKSKAKRRETSNTPLKAHDFGRSSSLIYNANDENEKEEYYTVSTLFSSKSFSSDSSEFYRSNINKKKKKKKKNRAKAPERSGAAVAGGFTVLVQKSSDPYMDFRSSMVEMIVEGGIKRGEDLEVLLDSYLTLNSDRHHPAILEAFADIWEAIFCSVSSRFYSGDSS